MVQALKAFPRIAAFLRDARGRILHRPDTSIRSISLGSAYGAHTVPQSMSDPNLVVYSFGVGTDVSFDLALIQRTNCFVHAFDPTPRSMRWVAQQDLGPRFKFHAFGLAEIDSYLAFQQPVKAENVSYARAQDNQPMISLPVRRLKTIMSDLGHAKVNLLKMDIEGFEYAAIDDMIAEKIFPDVVAVEFHHRMYGFTDDPTERSVNHLLRAGYRLFHVSDTGREYSFIHQESLPQYA